MLLDLDKDVELMIVPILKNIALNVSSMGLKALLTECFLQLQKVEPL